MISSAPRSPLRRALRAGAPLALAAALLALTGCAGTTVAAEPQRECVASEVPLAELDVLDAPRDWVGPSTACLADAGITAIDDAAEPQLPVTVVDDKGTEVTVTDASRILALDVSGSLAATVFGLGLGEQVVGRDSSTGFAEAAALPVVTMGGHQLSAEPILELAPTVILTDTTLGPPAVLAQLRDAGIPVVITTSERSIDTIGTVIEQVAAALGVPDAGTELTERVHAELTAVTADIEAIAPADTADRPRMLFLYVRGSAGVYYLFGEESAADALITSIGGVDVAGEIGWQGMRPVTAEALVEAAPDLVLVMSKGLESVNGVDGLLESIPALASTPAGENRRIVDMSDTEILSFGPRTPQVLEALARAVYAPEQSGPLAAQAQ
ncbi:iron complex transport system substrate-binding protein [Microterricola gilva]|uniref:Iron complex transport system substrate-binding protein n=1 Tax=Microterricola gilva TaxID=393267 RepID=A0A4V2GAD9_9MICO|nr:ABC transporter substrate-binding protein [Microterricola gilva]RZU63896.1 iron complex transport system substrate-binding protein [Microterricola gilva]